MTTSPSPQQNLFVTEPEYSEAVSYTAVLLTQGKHRFYTLAMPSEVLAKSCIVDLRSKNPKEGFQRALDHRRAEEIAAYIDKGFGTIPTSIILSAQPESALLYVRKTRTLRFKITPRSFLIIDGQHRVYGFSLALSTLRVPVVIYSGLNRSEECRLFININTKQRPVPNELLLDIKRMADTETNVESLFRDVFDFFANDNRSPLLGLMSPSARSRGKLSRVTFNTALKPIWNTFVGNDAEVVFEALAAYLRVWLQTLRKNDAEDSITNPVLFRAIMLLFPAAAERVSDRHGDEYTVENFDEVLGPFSSRIKKIDLKRPGASPVSLYENFKKSLESGFSIRRTR